MLQQVENGTDVCDFMPITAEAYVPRESQVVSPEVLAQVFEDKPLPFKTNADGSVDMGVYLEWLEAAGEAALQAFAQCSDVEEIPGS